MARSIELARVFYTIEAETKGLDGQLKSAEKSFDRFTKFVKDHPVAALGALAAAATVVAAQATSMAADVDSAVRQIGASLPSATGRIEDLKDAAKELSVQFGVSQVEIVGAMQSIARKGVDSVDELIEATKAVQLAVKASGESTETVIGLLDVTLDAFGLSAAESERILAKLFATTQGKTSLTELAAVFEKIEPIARKSGASFDTVAAAATTLIARGQNARTVLKELGESIKTGATESLEDLAAKSRPASEGLEAINAAAEANNNTLASLNARLKEGFNAALIELGNQILPVAIKALQELVKITDFWFGRIKEIGKGSSLATIESISGAIRSVNDEAEKTSALKRLGDAMQDIVDGPGGFMIDTFTKISRADFSKISGPTLATLKRGLEAAAASGKVTARQTADIEIALKKLNVAIADTPGLPTLAVNLTDAGAAAATTTTTVKKLTEAQIAAAAAAKKKAEAERLAKQVAGQALAVTIAATTEINTKYRPALDKIIDRQGALRTKLDQIFEAEAKLKDKEQLRAEHHLEIARQVEAAARGLIGVGQAAGLWSSETANTLQNVVSIASTVENILSSKDGKLDLSSVVSIMGAAATILSGIFGESAASRERKEIVRKNTEALRETADQIGNLLSISTPGAVFASASTALKQLLTPAGIKEVQETRNGVFAGINTGRLAGFLKDFGLRLSDLDELAKDFELTIRNKEGFFLAGALEDLFNVLTDEGDEFSTFGQTFQDQMEKIRVGLETGIIQPGEEFAAVLKGLGGIRGGAPSAITNALAGLDVTTAGGRTAATAALQDLVRNISTIAPEQFGGLTPKQFLDVVSRLIGILQSDTAITGFGGTSSSVSASLDAGFGGLAEVGDTTNALLEEIIANTAAFRPVAAPSILGGQNTATALGAGVSVGVINLSVNLSGIDTANPAATAQAIGDATFKALNERFARGVLDERAALGDVRRI